ncbi:hypothetical protein BE11_03680 [Sorangium cellulosum]|nr:hypothetical protein BE11_03680 [Sorangium cellulosum]
MVAGVEGPGEGVPRSAVGDGDGVVLGEGDSLGLGLGEATSVCSMTTVRVVLEGFSPSAPGNVSVSVIRPEG